MVKIPNATLSQNIALIRNYTCISRHVHEAILSYDVSVFQRYDLAKKLGTFLDKLRTRLKMWLDGYLGHLKLRYPYLIQPFLFFIILIEFERLSVQCRY